MQIFYKVYERSNNIAWTNYVYIAVKCMDKAWTKGETFFKSQELRTKSQESHHISIFW